MRARLLLLKQDQLSLLEQQLDRIDYEEPRKLFLGNSRRDGNESRKHVLAGIDRSLRDYGKTAMLGIGKSN